MSACLPVARATKSTLRKTALATAQAAEKLAAYLDENGRGPSTSTPSRITFKSRDSVPGAGSWGSFEATPFPWARSTASDGGLGESQYTGRRTMRSTISAGANSTHPITSELLELSRSIMQLADTARSENSRLGSVVRESLAMQRHASASLGNPMDYGSPATSQAEAPIPPKENKEVSELVDSFAALVDEIHSKNSRMKSMLLGAPEVANSGNPKESQKSALADQCSELLDGLHGLNEDINSKNDQIIALLKSGRPSSVPGSPFSLPPTPPPAIQGEFGEILRSIGTLTDEVRANSERMRSFYQSTPTKISSLAGSQQKVSGGTVGESTESTEIRRTLNRLGEEFRTKNNEILAMLQGGSFATTAPSSVFSKDLEILQNSITHLSKVVEMEQRQISSILGIPSASTASINLKPEEKEAAEAALVDSPIMKALAEVTQYVQAVAKSLQENSVNPLDTIGVDQSGISNKEVFEALAEVDKNMKNISRRISELDKMRCREYCGAQGLGLQTCTAESSIFKALEELTRGLQQVSSGVADIVQKQKEELERPEPPVYIVSLPEPSVVKTLDEIRNSVAFFGGRMKVTVPGIVNIDADSLDQVTSDAVSPLDRLRQRTIKGAAGADDEGILDILKEIRAAISMMSKELRLHTRV
ncbi:unnamed protein product [Schistocephalus solidus]|nr:unnamed protein product [Schistocephalus solidus]